MRENRRVRGRDVASSVTKRARKEALARVMPVRPKVFGNGSAASHAVMEVALLYVNWRRTNVLVVAIPSRPRGRAYGPPKKLMSETFELYNCRRGGVVDALRPFPGHSRLSHKNLSSYNTETSRL